jgi:hypothetical protein
MIWSIFYVQSNSRSRFSLGYFVILSERWFKDKDRASIRAVVQKVDMVINTTKDFCRRKTRCCGSATINIDS